MTTHPQVHKNGTGYIVHKLRVPFLSKRYSVWLSNDLKLTDCEGFDTRDRGRFVREGTAEWSAVQVAARQIVQRHFPNA